jgi:hypothetical protein
MQRVALLIVIFVFSVLLQSELIRSATAQEDSESVPAATEQDEPEQDELESQSEEEEAEEEADEEEIIVDDEFYQDVDDKDFRPSEDIPADQSISFPTDI